MDKKKFFEPEVKVVELDAREIICMSGGDEGTKDPVVEGGETGDDGF